MTGHVDDASAPALLLVVAAAVLYWRGWRRVRRHAAALRSPWRLCGFIGGALALWLALGSPLARLHHHFLMAHMLQHLLLTLCAAPLILLGAPAVPLHQGLPWRAVREGIRKVVRSARLRAVGRILRSPAVGWGVSTVVVVGWHVPLPFELARHSDGWHLLESATFFISGLLFWWPVIEPWPATATLPRWWKPVYLFGATLPCDVLAAFLAFSDRVVYPAYAAMPRPTEMTALQDQAGAGALMWCCVTFVYGVPASTVVFRWLLPQRAPRPRASTVEV